MTCDEARKSKYDRRTKIFARHAHFLPKPFTRYVMFVNYYFFFVLFRKNNVKNIKNKKNHIHLERENKDTTGPNLWLENAWRVSLCAMRKQAYPYVFVTLVERS